MISGSGYSREAKYHLYLVRAYRTRGDKRKTNVYIVRKDSSHARAERLGLIKWYGAFRQYVFYPDEGTVWSHGCLEIIKGFLKDKNDRHRKKLKKEREHKADKGGGR